MRVVTSHGTALRLGEWLDSGGEGVICSVVGRQDLVVKLLLRPRDRGTAIRRLGCLVRHGRSPRTAVVRGGTICRAAWPVDMVATADPDVTGYVMADMTARFRPFSCLLSTPSRREAFPEATWATSLMAGASLARLVSDLHAARYVVGDLKPENLWVDKYGNVGISDVDSFQFTDGRTFFPCTSQTAGCCAPEAIDVADPQLDESSDAFVLAVLIYRLLMSGMHPFYGQPADGSPYLSFADNVVHGRTRLVDPGSVLISAEAPPLSVLPAELITLFRRCFDAQGRAVRSSRPSAADWLAVMNAAVAHSRLRQCDAATSHVYTAERPACPWCELAGHSADPYARI